MAINRHVGDPREPRPGVYRDPEPDVAARALDHAWRFTETFREHADAHPAEREAACLAVQFPSTLIPLRPDDVVAARFVDLDATTQCEMLRRTLYA